MELSGAKTKRMSATAALGQAPASPSPAIAAMDADEHDVPPSSPFSAGGEGDLVDNLANVHLSTNPSSEEEDELPFPQTPEGFFVDSSANSMPWPTTATPPRGNPPQGGDHRHPYRSSLRPPSTQQPQQPQPISPTLPRPLRASSSSGALSAHVEPSVFLDGGPSGEAGDECPASRAVAAMRALEAANVSLVRTEMHHEGKDGGGKGATNLRDSSPEDEGESCHSTGSLSPPVSQQRAFPAYQSCANEPFPTNRAPQHRDLYAFSPHLAGRILTALSCRCVPSHRRHVHGGSALAGFLALLLVTCANYMLGPMRDAAALAVGVSHIPALTLASTALALGSSVPVGWLFEAPDPRRRRVWKRMGLTRGETQGTSLALFYRVFAFLLLSYALGFQMVDFFGNGRGRVGDDTEEAQAAAREESAMALVTTFFLRCFDGVGVPIIHLLANLEQRFSSAGSGMHQLLSSTTSTLQLYSDRSVPSLFLHACACIVNKSGKVIYVMFFLVVHLMKLHSLSLIWGVTTEAMEYEETAEQRRATPSKQGGTSNNNNKPSKSSMRLKRLGFVGFGGTIGGILGR